MDTLVASPPVTPAVHDTCFGVLCTSHLHLLLIAFFCAATFLHFRYLVVLPGEKASSTPTKPPSSTKKRKSDKKSSKQTRTKTFSGKLDVHLNATPPTASLAAVVEQTEEQPQPDPPSAPPTVKAQELLPPPTRVVTIPSPAAAPVPVQKVTEANSTGPKASEEKDSEKQRSQKKRRLRRLQRIAKCLKMSQFAARSEIVLDYSTFILLPGTVNPKANMQVATEPEADDSSDFMPNKHAPWQTSRPASSATSSSLSLNANAPTWTPTLHSHHPMLLIKSKSSPALLAPKPNKLEEQGRSSIPLVMPLRLLNLNLNQKHNLKPKPSQKPKPNQEAGEQKEGKNDGSDKPTAACKYGNSCVRKGCNFLHSAHHAAATTVRACRYDAQCSRADCHFAHPKGRLVPLVPASLDQPIQADTLPIPKVGFGKKEDLISQNLLMSQLGHWPVFNRAGMVPPPNGVLNLKTRHRVRIIE